MKWGTHISRPSYSEMLERFNSSMARRGWKHTSSLLYSKTTDFKKLKIAEVGCGTGTNSLMYGLLGAEVALIDYDTRVLENIKKIYEMWGVNAEFYNLSCLDDPPDNLLNKFDNVGSGGLAEHFLGEDRLKCIQFHYKLLKKGGFASIGVPNRFSVFYRTVVGFRRITGTFWIDIEVPFSNSELLSCAQKTGFDRSYVLGNEYLGRDFKVYSLGLASAVIDIMPEKLKSAIRSRTRKNKVLPVSCGGITNSPDYIEQVKGQILLNIKTASSDPQSGLADIFSAGIILFGFKD